MNSANCTVSPASPEKAMIVDGESWRVLSSEALRIVAPRIAALEAAIMVKSAPVRPRRTSLGRGGVVSECLGWVGIEVKTGEGLHGGLKL